MTERRISRPIVLVAAPRSGAALLSDLLSHGTAFSVIADGGALVDGVIGERRLRLTAADVRADIAAAVHGAFYGRLHHGRQRILDASPENAFRIGFLASVFPDAQFVLFVRDAAGAVGSAVAADGVTIEAAAQQWIDAASALAGDAALLAADRMHVIRFESFVEHPDAELARLSAFAGIPAHGKIGAISLPEPVNAGAAIEPFSATIEPLARALRALGDRREIPRAAPAIATSAPGDGAAFHSTATASFAEILQNLRSSLVVTTYQSGRVIVLRAQQDGALNTHFRALMRPMGVAVGRDRIAIGTDREIIEYPNHRAAARAIEPHETHDALFLPRTVYITGDISIHEMAYAGGELWGVNTRFSVLCTFDPKHSFVPRWQPPFVSALTPDDRCHLNGFAVNGEGIAYVTALAATDSADGWRSAKAAGGVIMDAGRREIVAGGLSMPHSPRLHQGALWVLESGRGTLARVDPAGGQVETIAEFPGFTRGLAMTGSLAFVGLSQVRESGTFGGIPLVQRVKDRVCGVWVVDIRDGRTLAQLRFDGIVQEIFDVQLLGGIAFPEILDRTDARVASTFEIPAPNFSC